MTEYRRTEFFYINENHEAFHDIDQMCLRNKALYNAILYSLRQIYFDCLNSGKIYDAYSLKSYPSNYDLITTMKNNDEYKKIGNTKVAQATIIRVYELWKGFIAAHHSYIKDKSKFNGKPKLPNYKDKIKGRYMLSFNYQAVSIKEYKNGFIKPACVDYKWYFRKFDDPNVTLQEVRISPYSNGYRMMVSYKENIDKPQIKPNQNGEFFVAGCDLGVSNLLAVAMSNGKGVIFSGNNIKYINNLYNSVISKAASKLPKNVFSSKKIRNLNRRRTYRIEAILHKIVNKLIEVLKTNNVDTLIVGNNKNWKQNINLGKKNNREFVTIPYYRLISILKYKAEENGLTIEVKEESYTSKASSIDKDHIPVYDKITNHVFSGKRIKRGIYKTKDGLEINADMNGAVNIVRKHVTHVDKSNNYLMWVKGCVVSPVKEKIGFN